MSTPLLLKATSLPSSPARVLPSTRPPFRIGALQERWHADQIEHEAILADSVHVAAGEGARLICLPELTLSRYFAIEPGGLSPDAEDHDQSVRANAWVLDGFIDALDLQDITMVVHDAGGPIGFLIATMRPERFRALVISNTFGWPLREYPSIRRMLKLSGGEARDHSAQVPRGHTRRRL